MDAQSISQFQSKLLEWYDGNARISANKSELTNKIVKKEIGDLVYELLPMERVGDFNQALMELGATICLHNRNPKCAECPVHSLCEGHHQGIAAELPIKSKKKNRRRFLLWHLRKMMQNM